MRQPVRNQPEHDLNHYSCEPGPDVIFVHEEDARQYLTITAGFHKLQSLKTHSGNNRHSSAGLADVQLYVQRFKCQIQFYVKIYNVHCIQY